MYSCIHPPAQVFCFLTPPLPLCRQVVPCLAFQQCHREGLCSPWTGSHHCSLLQAGIFPSHAPTGAAVWLLLPVLSASQHRLVTDSLHAAAFPATELHLCYFNL